MVCVASKFLQAGVMFTLDFSVKKRATLDVAAVVSVASRFVQAGVMFTL